MLTFLLLPFETQSMINRYIGHHNTKQVIHSIEEACKIYYVKLIKGKSFYAFDHRYLVSEEEEVSEKIYNYLLRNEFFEVRKEEYSA
ncbi:hypothetical protein ACS75_27100 [Bacillus thuringiensis]|nr:hypothetical protein ACS75_27100 [Bacillus thuringiensis]